MTEFEAAFLAEAANRQKILGKDDWYVSHFDHEPFVLSLDDGTRLDVDHIRQIVSANFAGLTQR
jgi:hypothetical protein